MKKIFLGLLLLLTPAAHATGVVVNGQLSGAQFESLAATPAVGYRPVGRFYWDTVAGIPKICDGANCASLINGATLPYPSASTLGGVLSYVAITNQWLDSISTLGVPHSSQPAFSNLSGQATASQMPAFTGDVTTSAGAVATTISVNAVTNAKAAQMAASTIKGNNTLATANAKDLTVAETKTLLNYAAVASSGSLSDLTGGLLAVARGGTGTSTAFTAGSVVFAGPSGTYTQDNSNLFWDDTNNTLGVGTAAPFATMEVKGTGAANVFQVSSSGGTPALIVDNTNFQTQLYAGTAAKPSVAWQGVNVDTGMFLGAAHQIALSTTGTERVRVGSTGLVGIGTTAPDQLLDVSASSTGGLGAVLQITNPATSTAGNATELRFAPSASHATPRYASIQGINRDGSNNIELAFITGAGSSITEKMRIDSAGKVGIGVATPLSTLNVAGTTGLTWAVAGNSLGLATIGTGGTSGGSLWVNTPSLNTIYHSGLGVMGTYNTPAQRSVVNLNAYGVESTGGYGSDLAFSTTSGTSLVEAMRIDMNASVGIGTTTPAYRLHVDKAVVGEFIGEVIQNSSSLTADSSVLELSTTGAPAANGNGLAKLKNTRQADGSVDYTLVTSPGGAAVPTLKYTVVGSTGYMGIGTSNPIAAALQVSRAGASSVSGIKADGAWFTGGSATTTKPHLLIEPAGTGSAGWATAGTGIAANGPSAFAGNLLDLQVAGVQKFTVSSSGNLTIPSSGVSAAFATLVGGFAGTLNPNQITPTFTSNGSGQAVRALSINPVYNQGSASSVQNTDLLINRTETNLGTTPGSQYMLDVQVGSLSKFNVTNAAHVGILQATPDAAGLQNTTAGSASVSAEKLDGVWYSGGSATTTKPHFLVEPFGITSTNWSTNGTGLAVNAKSTFTGNLADFQLNGARVGAIDYQGFITGQNFTSTKQGLVPLSGGGTSNFLRADGTWAAGTTSVATPTVQKFLSGSGNYTTPAGVLHLRVVLRGGGGGGAGSGTASATPAADGGQSTFGGTLLVATGGVHGVVSAWTGGAGGTATITTPVSSATAAGEARPGAQGMGGSLNVGGINLYVQGGRGGGAGGGGGGGANTAGGDGATNSGGGGTGGGGIVLANSGSGDGGGEGGYIDASVVPTAGQVFAYVVGAGGAGGTGTSGLAGGAGAAGEIIVYEYRQ